MAWREAAVRFLALTLLAIWLGGFTFYSAVVIPALHEVLSTGEAGGVTQRVTDVLNALGAAAVLANWTSLRWDKHRRSDGGGRLRTTLLALTTLFLACLVVLHKVMDAKLAAPGAHGFYPLHRVYLLVSTAQWLVNLGLIGVEASRGTPGR